MMSGLSYTYSDDVSAKLSFSFDEAVKDFEQVVSVEIKRLEYPWEQGIMGGFAGTLH